MDIFITPNDYIKLLSDLGLLWPVLGFTSFVVVSKVLMVLAKLLVSGDFATNNVNFSVYVPITEAEEPAQIEIIKCSYCGTKQSGNLCTQCGAPL